MFVLVLLIFTCSWVNEAPACPKLCFLCPCIFGDRYYGRRNTSFEAFTGIPYAEPPVGILRFQNPVKYYRKPVLMRPMGDRPPCIQRNIFSYKVHLTGDEDCLYLNIYRPVLRDLIRLPVLVYFPHGNLLYGSGHSRDVSPDTLMESGDVVLVVVQYRVGLMGFFTTGDHWAPGNLGLKDQMLALQWIKANIDFFRGNPNDVTVFGDASVQYHLLRQNITFHKTIISGSYIYSYNRGAGAMTIPEALELTNAFSNYIYSRVLYSQELVSKLQSEPVEILLSVRGGQNEKMFYPFRTFGPVIENYVRLENEDPTQFKALERTNNLLWQSVQFPKFLRGRPRQLWENLLHNVPMLFGSSEFYGEQWVEIVEDYIKNLDRMRTDAALRLFLNLETDTSIQKILHHYKLQNNSVFRIERSERDRYIKMFNSRFYNHALLALITVYNNNKADFRNLFLYFLNDHVRTNDAELYHLFPPSFQTVYDVSLPVITIFEEFISTGRGPFHSPCIIDEEHKTNEQCVYFEVNVDSDGREETSQPKAFDLSAVEFWNAKAPLLDF